MTENRVNWKLADVHHTTMLLPGPYREYLKGMIAFLNGHLLLTKVEAQDPDVLEGFSDKQPRLPFNETELALLLKRSEGDAIHEEIKELKNFVDERKLCQAEAKEAADGGDELMAQYWFARDYAYSYLIRGLYKMIEEEQAGRSLPKGIVKLVDK